MNAKELINLLQHVPPETKIVVRGYEDGYNDIQQLKPVKIMHNSASKWYYGEYFGSEAVESIDAVELFGENLNAQI